MYQDWWSQDIEQNLTSDLMKGSDGVTNNGGTLINVYSYDVKLDKLRWN